jgi:hypothetical protein
MNPATGMRRNTRCERSVSLVVVGVLVVASAP